MDFIAFRRPYRFFLIAAALALLMCLLPTGVPERKKNDEGLTADAPQTEIVPAGADLSEKTGAGCTLHETLLYESCGHSVQRREQLPARLVGLTRPALEEEIVRLLPGASVTGFSASEVDVSRGMAIPCPLHWVLRGGEDGRLHVYQNRTGEGLTLVRDTDVPLERVSESERQEMLKGRLFHDVQALEGYLESMSS